MNRLKKLLGERILVLDGGLGTMIQKLKLTEDDFRGREFIKHKSPLRGFNDILNVTKPNSIKQIHKEYLVAGANIITTNTFNSNSISIKDYGMENISGIVFRLNREGAILAREAIDEVKQEGLAGDFFVGGSIGPTNRSASMSPDITDPFKRNVTFDELFDAYREQIKGLIDGGVDLLICETFFDTLNLKAALKAANETMREKKVKLPIMVSATISDKAGRILSGQTLEAFIASISPYENVLVSGLNCGFGPDRMYEYVRQLNKINPYYTSCHPNAGLPDVSGCYNVSPEEFKNSIRILLEERCLNIVGGCCGTTPDFIRDISSIVEKYQPRELPSLQSTLLLSGLDVLNMKEGFLTVGERCNVAGSAKFLRLIKEGSYEEAASVARQQIEKGARVIDINVDDPLLNAEEEMVRFVRYILADPEVAKVPFMIDSSKWDVIESALKNIQGKGIVNSLSLKEGEEIFKERALRVKELGFALVVMAFDERGQADTYERKIEICERAYNILTRDCGFSPEDIIFDVNVMTIATGMPEHSRYAVDFINAVGWIKKNLTGARTSGGVSNLSFAFRGKNKIREYMHVIFLYHAQKAGLDMAIINPSQTTLYEEIPNEIRESIEDVIFDRDEDAVEHLVKIANEDVSKQKELAKVLHTVQDNQNIEVILKNDLIKGELLGLEAHIKQALEQNPNPVEIIEGPLLQGMIEVGDLFGEGKMFLPQVVKTARSMKRAVEILTPYIEKSREETMGRKAGKILIATVKGDVHDIGKNIVSTVLACNNYEVIDLGIMVPAEKIVEEALRHHPDIICLSGLITPSLGEMTETVRQLAAAGIDVPVMVGGAATSELHTAIKISPAYSGIVIHAGDASRNPIIAGKILNPTYREEYLNEIRARYLNLCSKGKENKDVLPFCEVIKIVAGQNRNRFFGDKPNIEIGRTLKIDIDLPAILPYVNWKMFFMAWKIQGSYLDNFPFEGEKEEWEIWVDNLSIAERTKANEALKLYEMAQKIVKELIASGQFDGSAVVNFQPARGDIKNLYINGKEFPMLRQQRKGTDFLSCSDFVGSEKEDYVGLFAVTAGHYINGLAKKIEDSGDPYKSLIVQTLADRIVEAASEWLHIYVNQNIRKVTIRPAWGYPMLPDQTLILATKEFLPFESIGVKVTENGALYPPASVSGLYFSKPDAKYFMVGEIGEDQLSDYSQRRCIETEKARELLRLR